MKLGRYRVGQRRPSDFLCTKCRSPIGPFFIQGSIILSVVWKDRTDRYIPVVRVTDQNLILEFHLFHEMSPFLLVPVYVCFNIEPLTEWNSTTSRYRINTTKCTIFMTKSTNTFQILKTTSWRFTMSNKERFRTSFFECGLDLRKIERDSGLTFKSVNIYTFTRDNRTSFGPDQSCEFRQPFLSWGRKGWSVDPFPARLAISEARSPQIPLHAMRIVSPLSHAFVIVHSIAPWPVADNAIVIVFSVWKRYWIPFLISSYHYF